MAEDAAPPPDASLPPGTETPGGPARATFIPSSLVVQPFAPPAPPAPKLLPSCRVDASVTVRAAGSSTLTLARGEASTAPDLPSPPPPQPLREPKEPTPEQTARRLWHLRHNLNLGATVYDHRVSVVQWTDPANGTAYEAVCGFDIGLLAGVGGFVHEGERYSLMLFHSNIDTTAARLPANRRLIQRPEVAEGEIIIRKGGQADALNPASLAGKVIAAEKDRLVAFQAAREAYRKESAAWTAAHPPVPQDETFIFRPHRGSRYLEKEGGTK